MHDLLRPPGFWALVPGGLRFRQHGAVCGHRRPFEPTRFGRTVNVQTVDDGIAAGAFAGKRVLVRVDFNAPINNGRVADNLRLEAAIPTIQALSDAGARVVLLSHLGRPKGERIPDASLAPVARRLGRLMERTIAFAEDCVGGTAQAAVDRLQDGGILLLENLRYHAGETANDDDFVRQLAALGDVFVNDAFGTAHRAHASTTGLAALLPAYAGKLIQKELAILGDALADPARPFTAILGGAKVSDKLAVIEALLEKADQIIIGGGMAFTFLKAQGHEVGASLVEDDRLEYAREMLAKAKAAGVTILLPSDVEEARKFEEGADHRAVRVGYQAPTWMGLDIGPDTIRTFAHAIAGSGTVLWNGPMGVFEWESFQFGTRAVAQAMVDCAGVTIVGGGDSAAAARKFGISHRVTHVSTGGGASLEFLEGKPLPGIVALENAKLAEAT